MNQGSNLVDLYENKPSTYYNFMAIALNNGHWALAIKVIEESLHGRDHSGTIENKQAVDIIAYMLEINRMHNTLNKSNLQDLFELLTMVEKAILESEVDFELLEHISQIKKAILDLAN